MSETKNLKLYKHDEPLENNTNKFDIDKSLNQNWDKIDNSIGDINLKIEQLEEEQTEQNEQIDMLLNALPTETQENEYINLKGTIPVKFKEFKVSGNSKQETSDTMPSPEYPSEIQNVEGDVNITVANKNIANSDWAERFVEVINNSTIAKIENVDGRRCLMFHCSPGYQNEEAYFFKGIFKENTQYVIEYDIKPTQQASNVDIFCKDGTKYGNINGSSLTVNSWNKSKYTTATSKTVDYIRVGYYTGTCYIDLDTMQITEGTEANDYVENKQQTVTFPLSEGQKLYKGDYLADDGIHHKRTQIELDGTENWFRQSIQHVNIINLYLALEKQAKNRNIIYCSIAKQSTAVGQNNDTNANVCNFNISLTNFLIDLSLEKFDSIETWKAYLAEQKQAGTPVILEYELAEEEIEPYTQEQQEAYNQLKQLIAYEEETNIYSTNSVRPIFKVTAVKDVNSVITQLNQVLLERS